MCGLFGYVGPGDPDPAALHLVAELAARRGPHAWGIAWEDERGIGFHKEPRSYSKRAVNLPGPAVHARRLIGHCRLSTSGPPTDNLNNQPMLTPGVAVVHNGNVYQHRAWASLYSVELATDCDSELLAHLLGRHGAAAALGVAGTTPYALMAIHAGRLLVARSAQPLFVWRRPEGLYLSSQPGDGFTPLDADLYREETTAMGLDLKKQATPARQHPLSNIRWVDPATLHANDYNPNHVFSPELKLLKLSILEDGWTQPIVVRPDGEIVDGFHRWTLGLKDDEVRAVSGNLVPVVVLAEGKSKSDQIIATVRHNRARGQHGVLKMGAIVRQLQAEGLTAAEIERRLGMDPEERDRLGDMRGSPEKAGKDSFGRGWVPVPSRE